MKRPRVVITASGDVILTFPYNRGLVEALKREEPSYARSYDPATKEWMVTQPYVAVAGALVEATFPDTEVIDFSTNFSRPNPSPSAPDEYRTLHLLPSAPQELVEAAYKCLSRLYHPDRGGDTQKMQALNAAVSVIRRRIAS